MNMSMIKENLKYLRKLKGWTQEQLAQQLDIKRSLIGAYEEGRADPPLTNLQKIAELFQMSIDDLINREISVQSGPVESTSPLKVLSITVDDQERENIELIGQKASAGYLNGYADPEYLEDLPKFKLPFLAQNATYRAFEISGDSMLPLQPGTIVIGKYIEDLKEVQNSKTYVILSQQEGVVYKRVFNYVEDNGKLFLVSDNTTYPPYELAAEDVLEIWEAKAFISVQFPDPKDKQEMSVEELTKMVLDLQQEVIKLKQ